LDVVCARATAAGSGWAGAGAALGLPIFNYP
jgi:hypothetical protein